MYIQKKEIKKQANFLANQSKLKFLFQNKKIEQYILEVENIQQASIKVSQFANIAYQRFKQILQKNERAMEILNSPKTDWKVSKTHNNSQLAFRVSGSNIQMRYEGLLPMNIQNLCIMIYQVNLFHQWLPFCTKGQDLIEVSPLQKICSLQFKIPFLSERYAYFYGMGIDRIDSNGTIIIYGQGITQNQEFMSKFDMKPDTKKFKDMVLMDIKYFISEISHPTQNQFLFKSYFEMDSRMPFLPQWLINTVLRQLGGFIFQKVMKQAQNLKGTVWEQQIKTDKNNPFYPWLHQRISAWEEKKNKQLNKSKI